ncbi:MAG: hypothetical protein H6555_10890 [Lewinellaceae bacterium]|nr:hypothetical protein [Lewinellaceae bacterium]
MLTICRALPHYQHHGLGDFTDFLPDAICSHPPLAGRNYACFPSIRQRTKSSIPNAGHLPTFGMTYI